LGSQIMNRTMLCSFAMLSLWSCLTTQVLFASPDTAQAAGTTTNGTRRQVDINDLFQHWVRSSEEEQPGVTVQIFRPATSMNFPPSRFRMAYKFAPNGSCEFYFLSPDDDHHFKPCAWTISDDRMILKITANRKSTSFRIAQLTGKSLRLKPLELPTNN
jgi:hypothetical protein